MSATKNFPPMMRVMMSDAERENRRTWPGWGNKENKCQNCGDWGFFSLTVAQSGPFNTPTVGKDSTMSDKLNGRTVWYSVKTFTFQCPDCQGGTKVDSGVFRPVSKAVEQLAESFE